MLIVNGFQRYLAEGLVPALLVSLAVLVAGPLEGILKAAVRRRKKVPKEEPAVELVDLATSIGFLIFLILAIRLM